MAVTLNESSWTLITEVQESPSELGGKIFNRVYGKIKTRYGAAHNVTLISFEWRVGILYNSSGGVYNSYTRAHSFTMTNPVVNEPYSGNWAFGGRYYTNGAETVKASWEKAVYHDDNGQYSHTMTMTFGGWNNENRTATQTVNLPAYSRYSTLSVGNYNLGSAVTATVTQQASGFSSIVYYRYPGLSSTWAELGRATGSTSLSISGTPSNVVSQITNSTTVTAEFKVRTYFANDYSGDYLETSPTKTVTASVPSSYKPTLTLAAVTEGNSAISTAFGSGTFVNGYSKLNAKGTFGASAGSTPISYTFTYNGIDNNITSTASTYTFQFTPVSGVGTVYGKVTDSRGRVSSQVNKTFTAYDYTPPTIQIRATRGTYSSDTFTADIFGTAVRVEAKWTCSSVNSKNAAQSIVVNDGTADRATYTPSSLSANDWTVIANIKNVTYATTSQYTFTARISDKLKSATATATIGTSSMPLSLYHQNGQVGAAVGQMASSAEAGKFNVYLPTNLTEETTIKDIFKIDIKGSATNYDTDGYREVVVNVSTAELKEKDSTLTSSSGDSQWLTALLKVLVEKYPLGRSVLYRGKIYPNSYAFYSIFIYSTNELSSGLPRYAFGWWQHFYNFYQVGTNNYSVFIRGVTLLNYSNVSNGSTAATYRPALVPGLNGDGALRASDNLYFEIGTASDKYVVFAIGKANIRGYLRLFDHNSSYYAQIRPIGGLTANHTYDLPNVNGTIALTSQLPTTGTASSVFTRTGGLSGSTCDYAHLKRYGNVVTIYAKFTCSTQAGTSTSNRDIFTGTMNNANYPPYDVEAFAYYGTSAIGLRITPQGVVTVRNASGGSVTISDSIFFSVTYVL